MLKRIGPFIGLCTAVLFSFSSSAQYNMHFFVPDFPPYTTVNSEGVPVGIGIDKMDLVLDSIDVKYSIEVGSNHGRALKELRRGRSDGFYMASKNDERDRYAVFSESLMINRWVWVVLMEGSENLRPKSLAFKTDAKVMSLLNTNTSYWLLRNEYKALPPAADIKSLVTALDEKQVDAIFVAEVVFSHLAEGSNKYKIILEKEKEFGIYVSNDFVEENPMFMFELNSAIREHR
ncbi:transporter substrate-binding domain-containing protein [Vibrio lamellibrachiae]|uniref:substrate-binding periplasmic protein n=1 Tax=Vibrio lamellibrachiae TaxID=2910253 RepID=UPI003D0CDFF1